MKFKKGDKVRCIKGCEPAFSKGVIYTVRSNEFDECGNLLIELDNIGSKSC